MTTTTNKTISRSNSPSNTAKVSSPILIPRTVSYDAGTNPPARGSAYLGMTDSKSTRRRRSSSILQIYQEPQEPIEQLSDQSALPNLNANWVNAKGMLKYYVIILEIFPPLSRVEAMSSHRIGHAS